MPPTRYLNCLYLMKEIAYIAMVAPVEVGEGGIDLLVSNGLLQQHQTADRVAVVTSLFMPCAIILPINLPMNKIGL